MNLRSYIFTYTGSSKCLIYLKEWFVVYQDLVKKLGKLQRHKTEILNLFDVELYLTVHKSFV